MSEDDPFGERTIIKPSPGGRRREEVSLEPRVLESFDADLGTISSTGANPILKAATPLLAVGSQLRRSVDHESGVALFRQLTQGIREFEAQLKHDRDAAEDLSVARYMLCAFLDEAILNTPWGADSNWSSHTLLAEFYNESFAGEKVFELQSRMMRDPRRYLHLLELVYVCLSMGFRGKFRLDARGDEQLEEVRRTLYREISQLRGSSERELSPHWQGVQDLRPKLTRFLPVWLFVAASVAIMVIAFVVLLWSLEGDSDPVVAHVASLNRQLDAVVDRPVQVAIPQQDTLVSLLKGRLSGGVVEPGRHENSIVLRELFRSGSADLDTAYSRDLSVIADVLRGLTGRIVITGHSDNVPIRSILYPSNWQLSEARAESIANVLVRSGVPASRIDAEPRADTEPVCASCNQDSPQERARNRRVEIELLAGASRI